jgi:hypothetical protein
MGSDEIQQVRWLRETAHLLGLPHYAKATALYLLHRLRVFDDNNSHVGFCACLSLAMKAEETVRKLKDILTFATQIVKQKPLDQAQLTEYRDRVMIIEIKLLQDMRFDLVLRHPYRFALAYFKIRNCSVKVGETCWAVINESYNSNICIRFPPNVISIAALIISNRLLKSEDCVETDNNFLTSHKSPKKITFECIIEITKYYMNNGQSDSEKLEFGKLNNEFCKNIFYKLQQLN